MKMKVELSFEMIRETKNALVYGELDDKGNMLETAEAKVGTIYLKKSVTGDKFPKTLHVTIEAETGKSASKKSDVKASANKTPAKKVAVKKKAA
jgi:hypothetical protein